MSESDDTDVLLLIPPDFFLVHCSDSEDSLEQQIRDKYTDKRDFERLLVNDLISQVSELENRVCVIESKNSSLDIPNHQWEGSFSFDNSTILDSNCYQYLQFKELPLKSQSMFIGGNKFGGSSENFKSFHSTPIRQKQSSSLPSTPSGEICRYNNHNFTHVPKHEGNMSSPRGRNAITVEHMTPSEILSMSHPVLDNKSSPSNRTSSHSYAGEHKQQVKNYDLLGEIDHFLNSAKKNAKPPIYTKVSEDRPYLCGENSSTVPDYNFGLRDFNNLPVREETVRTKHIASLEKGDSRKFKEAQPQTEEVNQFLNNIGDNTTRVDRSMVPNQQKNEYICGYNENSVPDLGYGLKSFNTLPVREETVSAKNIAPLQTQEMKGLELSDIEKLLKQMEATHFEIEKKLQLREALLGKGGPTFSGESHISAPDKAVGVGDTVDSVPDRGFGVRGILYPSKPEPSSNSMFEGNGGKSEDISKLPVTEEPFTKRNMSLLGSDIAPQKKNESQVPASTESANAQQDIPTVQEHVPKISLAKRKLELGGDASTVPDLGFGLKNWYQNTQEGFIESQAGSSHNIPHSSNNQRLTDAVSANKESNLLGEYVGSVPDLGFGLRSLWGNDRTQGTSCIPKLSHSSSYPEQTHKDRDLKSIECALVSQIEVPGTIGDNRNKYPEIGVNAKNQPSEPPVEEATVKKKVDFTVNTGREDAVFEQQDYWAGAKGKLELQSSFPDSGLAASASSSGSGNLLSLSELWGKEGSAVDFHIRDERVNIRVKLEEERYRRQHCEKMIHHLQSRLLEEQQKLAVAIQVDKGKDQAILQLQDAWSRLVHHWRELEEQRHSLASRLQSEREANQRLESEWLQKAKKLECELSKALDLAQGYKDKLDAVDKEKSDLLELQKKEIEARIRKIQEVEEKLDKANQLHNQLIKEKNGYVEKIKQAEQATQKERKLLLEAQNDLRNMQKKLESYEAEISALTEEKETVQLKLKEEKGRVTILDQQKKSLQSSLDESKKKEKSVRDEMKQLSSQMEKVKLELREYYQEQLDIVVRDKLREFQEQLDAAETGLHKELEQREQTITEIASKQVKQISEKHQLEVQLLEEKHTEELHLYKLQLAQAMQQISQLESKLQVYNSRKSEIVEKLHSVMETQWQEALRIVSGNSPLLNNGSDPSKLQRGGNLTKIGTGTWPLSKHKSENTETVPNSKTFHHDENKVEGWGSNKEKLVKPNKMVTSTPQNFPEAAQFHVPPIHVRDQSGESSTADESPFCQEGVLTSRMAEQATPPTKGSAQITYENELRKYIMMLLNRSPGNPMDDSHQVGPHTERKTQNDYQEKKEQHLDMPTNETVHLSKWEKVLKQDSEWCLANSRVQNIAPVPDFDLYKTGNSSTRDGRHMKPPWK